MESPKQIAAIFEILSRGQFICSNRNDESFRKLYSAIEEEQNFDFLYGYFLSINFILEKGDEYYYLTRVENKIDLERNIDLPFKAIDNWIIYSAILKLSKDQKSNNVIYSKRFNSWFLVISIGSIKTKSDELKELGQKISSTLKITDE